MINTATNSEQIERIRLQIRIYEMELEKEPNSQALVRLLQDAKELLKQISK